MNEHRVARITYKRYRCLIQCLVGIFVLLAVAPTTNLAQPPTSPANQDSSEDRVEIIRLENKWLAALMAANVDAIREVLADDFLRPAPDSGRFVNKSQLLSFYRSHLSAQNPNTKHMEGLTVTVYDSTALARGTLITTDSKGQAISKLLFTDVFVRRLGKWQAVSAQEDKVTAPTEQAR